MNYEETLKFTCYIYPIYFWMYYDREKKNRKPFHFKLYESNYAYSSDDNDKKLETTTDLQKKMSTL